MRKRRLLRSKKRLQASTGDAQNAFFAELAQWYRDLQEKAPWWLCWRLSGEQLRRLALLVIPPVDESERERSALLNVVLPGLREDQGQRAAWILDRHRIESAALTTAPEVQALTMRGKHELAVAAWLGVAEKLGLILPTKRGRSAFWPNEELAELHRQAMQLAALVRSLERDLCADLIAWQVYLPQIEPDLLKKIRDARSPSNRSVSGIADRMIAHRARGLVSAATVRDAHTRRKRRPGQAFALPPWGPRPNAAELTRRVQRWWAWLNDQEAKSTMNRADQAARSKGVGTQPPLPVAAWPDRLP